MYLMIAMISQGLSVSQNVFLASWAGSNDAEKPKAIAISNFKDNAVWNLSIYGIIGLCFSFATILQVIFVWVYCGIRSSRVMHSKMLNNIVRFGVILYIVIQGFPCHFLIRLRLVES